MRGLALDTAVFGGWLNLETPLVFVHPPQRQHRLGQEHSLPTAGLCHSSPWCLLLPWAWSVRSIPAQTSLWFPGSVIPTAVPVPSWSPSPVRGTHSSDGRVWAAPAWLGKPQGWGWCVQEGRAELAPRQQQQQPLFPVTGAAESISWRTLSSSSGFQVIPGNLPMSLPQRSAALEHKSSRKTTSSPHLGAGNKLSDEISEKHLWKKLFCSLRRKNKSLDLGAGCRTEKGGSAAFACERDIKVSLDWKGINILCKENFPKWEVSCSNGGGSEQWLSAWRVFTHPVALDKSPWCHRYLTLFIFLYLTGTEVQVSTPGTIAKEMIIH